jgi:hypothetical protein
MMYAAVEMAIEAPAEEAQINNEVCWMVCLYYAQLGKRLGSKRPEASA